MTDGHKHREITLKRHGIALHLLQTPLTVTTDRARAMRSRWVWGQEIEWDGGDGVTPIYTITPLSILHTLTGLAVNIR